MTRCSAITDPFCGLHDHPSHPECNARLVAVCAGLDPNITLFRAAPALLSDVHRVHDPSYTAWLSQRCSAMTSIGFLDADTYITRYSFDVARHAAGAAIAAVERALDGDHCFSLMRPPGHHAVHNRAMGFCLLNNCAIAVKKCLDTVDRIAIVDWDVHHGNGTQQAFYGTDRVLYCSVHQENHFPYSGSIGETGVGEGKGYTINVPLVSGSDIGDYALVFSEIFAPSIRRFQPDIVIISAGQDILSDDPFGGMNILPQDFESLTRIVSGAAGTPLALVLEGGYGVSHGSAVRHIFSALRSDGEPSVPEMSHRSTQNRVALLKKVHHLA